MMFINLLLSLGTFILKTFTDCLIFGEIHFNYMERLCTAHLASRALVPAPGLHDERIIDGDAYDLLDPLPLDISSLLHVAREMGLAAAGGEGSGHAEHHNLDKRLLNIFFAL